MHYLDEPDWHEPHPSDRARFRRRAAYLIGGAIVCAVVAAALVGSAQAWSGQVDAFTASLPSDNPVAP